MRRFGLIGRNISYSFSAGYFAEKFVNENCADCVYENFDLAIIDAFPKLIQHEQNLYGFNVTIPYKQEIIPFLDELDPTAASIGAVNTIKVYPDGRLKGFNTDYIGFRDSLTPLLKSKHQKALILGTGGASKAVAFALDTLQIPYKYVSRKPKEGAFTYEDLTAEVLSEYQLIVNCTPLGTFPEVDKKPNLHFALLGTSHLLYDLIYNPSETAFMKFGRAQGATVTNGLQMLIGQAEAAWRIWNDVKA
ncbi:MAG: shikimate dehydrogenase [Flavobacteriaceae bacterium]|nr:shikimate dehydrogenase [Flavobacteriaceae bacterium]